MKLDALDHPKTLDFAARLGVELPTAIGHLELLWAFTGKKAPQGDIGKWPDGAIARACYWMGRPEVFLLALRESGFIEADDVHRLIIHDWQDHATGWVRAKLKKLGLSFVTSLEPSSEPTREPTIEPSSEGTIERSRKPSIQAKRSEAKGSEAKSSAREGAHCDPPPGLDIESWDRWLDYRSKIRRPLKPVSIPAAQRELAAFGADQAAVVQQSIANGWQGLFEVKRVNGAVPARSRVKLKTADEIEAEERARVVA